MTSQFRYRIDISRHLDKDNILMILKELEDGTILKFPEGGNMVGPYFLVIDACGYITLDRTMKVVKLTNSQRRVLIREASQSLKLKTARKSTITVPGNDYTSGLPNDEF